MDGLICRLPDEVREEALRVNCEIRSRSKDNPDRMGNYSRSGRRIILYVEPIYEQALEESRGFATEVETTYLHELGHHLGLNEDEIEMRGL